MGVERGLGLGSVAAGPSVGPAVSIGPSMGPSTGRVVAEAPVIGSRIGLGSTIIKEGPVAPKFLENTMPLTLNSFKPLGEIIFNPEAVPSVLTQAEQVAAAAWKATEPALVIKQAVVPSGIRQAEQIAAAAWEVPRPAEIEIRQPQVETVVLPQAGLLSEADAVREAEYWLAMHRADRIQAARVIEFATQAGIKPEVSRRWVINALPATQAQAKQDSQAQTWTETKQQVVEEQEVIEEEGDDQQVETLKREQSREIRRRYVVDERALSQIVVEIKAAVVKAKEAAGELGIRLTGLLVDKFLPGQHPGNESEVVKGKGPDGSIPERKETIRAHGEFTSEIEAENTGVKIAYEKPPVAIRQHGQPVSTEDVYRVYKEHRVKPKPVTEVRLRVVKKETFQKTTVLSPDTNVPLIQHVKEHKEESRIEDDPELAEVFQKVA